MISCYKKGLGAALWFPTALRTMAFFICVKRVFGWASRYIATTPAAVMGGWDQKKILPHYPLPWKGCSQLASTKKEANFPTGQLGEFGGGANFSGRQNNGVIRPAWRRKRLAASQLPNRRKKLRPQWGRRLQDGKPTSWGYQRKAKYKSSV